MKLRVERDALTDAVTWVSRTLPSRPASPLLAGIQVVADEQGLLTFSAFDYEVSAQLSCPGEVIEGGTVLVVGKLLAEICRSLPNKTVDLQLEGNRINVACGSSRFHLPAMPHEEYPELPAMPQATGTLAGEEFARAVAQVSVAASKDDTLPILTGVRLEITGTKVTMMATDRYRLALREITWNTEDESLETDALVRARTLSEAAKTLGTSGANVTVALSQDDEKRLIGFANNSRHSTSLLLDGDYPKVKGLFPDNAPIFATVERTSLLEAVKRVALVAERNAPVRLTFTDGVVQLEAGQNEDAQADERLEAHLTGEDISTAFNPQFLIDGLNALESEHIRLSFTHAAKPAVLTGQAEPQGDDDTTFKYLLMPVRLNG